MKTSLYKQITNNSLNAFNEFIDRFIIPSDDDEQMRQELLDGFKEKLYLNMKNNIKTHLFNWIKNKIGSNDTDINTLPLNKYMDSLDIFDLMAEVEDHYNIEVTDKELLKWYDYTLDDISEFVVKKLEK